MWEELDFNRALDLFNWLPNHQYRKHAMTAQLTWMFQSFAGGKPGPFLEWLPAWMRPEGGKTEPFFTPTIVNDVDLAFQLDYLSQGALAALGPTRLRASGAFKQ